MSIFSISSRVYENTEFEKNRGYNRATVSLRRVYRYILSQKWDSESILYTSWWDKNLKKNHSKSAENINFTY